MDASSSRGSTTRSGPDRSGLPSVDIDAEADMRELFADVNVDEVERDPVDPNLLARGGSARGL